MKKFVVPLKVERKELWDKNNEWQLRVLHYIKEQKNK